MHFSQDLREVTVMEYEVCEFPMVHTYIYIYVSVLLRFSTFGTIYDVTVGKKSSSKRKKYH